MGSVDFTTVTEITGYNVTSEQLHRMYTRYRFALDYCERKEVLEVACGTGQGLGFLAKKAKKVVGGDFDENIVKLTRNYYKDRIDIKQIDAHSLPFDNKSFDVVLCYEAIYYLQQPERFIAEASRVLRDRGVLIICTANKDWSGFNPSPYSHQYYSAPELFLLLSEKGFYVKLFADCPAAGTGGIKDALISFIKKVAVKLRLMPKTMKGKEKLKRLFLGKLKPLPPEITDEMSEYTPPVSITADLPNLDYKVLFAVGRKI